MKKIPSAGLYENYTFCLLQLLCDHRYHQIDKYIKTYFLCTPPPLFSPAVSLSPYFLVPICSSVFFFSLCQTLATAQGNILENRELIDSLNQTKASSALIQESLLESHRLQASIDQVLYSSPYAHTSLHHFLCGMINFYKLHLSWKKWKHIYDYYIFHS